MRNDLVRLGCLAMATHLHLWMLAVLEAKGVIGDSTLRADVAVLLESATLHGLRCT